MENNNRFVLSIAMLATLLGLAGLVFGVVSKNKADELRQEFSQVQDLVEKIRDVDEKSSGISDSATRLGKDVERMAQQVAALRNGTQEALDKVKHELTRFGTDLNSNISKARGLEERIADLQEMWSPAPEPVEEPAEPIELASVPAPDEAPSRPARESKETVEIEEPEEETWHVIEPGDTLSRVASRYGVSLGRLEEANPGVNPLRLQIGQRIRVPAR